MVKMHLVEDTEKLICHKKSLTTRGEQIKRTRKSPDCRCTFLVLTLIFNPSLNAKVREWSVDLSHPRSGKGKRRVVTNAAGPLSAKPSSSQHLPPGFLRWFYNKCLDLL